MRLRELKSGTRICPELRLNAHLDTHNGIARYLASDSESGHVLVHIIPDFENDSYAQLEKAAKFYREDLSCDVRCGHYEEFLYFSEPFPLGEFMFEWLERRERVQLPEALKRIISLLKVLHTAHSKGIYHGRITPQSLLMERSDIAFGLRMMGFGVSQALNESMKNDIDWFDYTFDLEGMNAAAVDIYGVAIVLMGLVSGEAGIDSFEATGLLPQSLRGGILQTAMERALALRIDSYANILAFSQDLEAALLELDERQGEVFVGDLVGFENAVRSIPSYADEEFDSDVSGVWHAMFDSLEQEERSSLLCSLTSLTAVKGDEEEDEDVTRVTSLPESVLGLQRIKTHHGREDASSAVMEPTSVIKMEDTDPFNKASGAEQLPDTEDGPRLAPASAEKLANIQSLEAELEDDVEDDAPTRVMMRPNYFQVTSAETSKGVVSAIEEVINSNKDAGSEETQGKEEASDKTETEENDDPIAKMAARIRQTTVDVSEWDLKHDVLYDEKDPVAFPPEDDIPAEEKAPEVQEEEDVKPLTVLANTVSEKKEEPEPTPVSKPKHDKSKLLHVLLIVFCALIVLFLIILASSGKS
ncbi:MAG: hypothetical protein IJ165_00545 [Proteobacteria bacterium]|nr:hypothetical protein [Pseudomonadota bacterium]